MIQSHMEPHPIPQINETYNGKSDKYFVELKLRWYPTPSTSELYELKKLFDHGKPE